VTTAAQRELLLAYRTSGDPAARERLIEEHMPLVRALAKRYAGRGEPLEDLVQVGAIGLIKAIDRYDPERGAELSTYAVPTIVGELRRHFRDKSWAVHVPRRLKELNQRLARFVDQLTRERGRSPTVAELAKAAGVEEEEVIDALESGHAYTARSLSAPPGEEDLDPLESLGEEDEGYGAAEHRTVLAEGLRALDEREREIIRLRFYEGLTQSQIAREVGISQMHVSRLIRKALETMREELET
jgi:RNA polymerase sigma-B factor